MIENEFKERKNKNKNYEHMIQVFLSSNIFSSMMEQNFT